MQFFFLEKFSVLMATCSGTRNNEDSVLKCVQALADRNVDVNAFDRLVLYVWTSQNKEEALHFR